MIEQIKEFSKAFFEKLWIELDSFDVILEQEDKYIIKIETADFDILIWDHWTTFESVQGILRNIFSNKYDKKIKLHLKINNYKHNRDSKLFAMIDIKISFAKKTGDNIELPLLNGYERKKVHSYVHSLKDDTIKTKSRWEWKNRKMFIVFGNNTITKKIEKKWSGLEIDIDWDDI